MYHCHLHFYLLGQQEGVFDIIKEMPVFEHFTHDYMESSEPEEKLAAKADVVFADLRNLDAKKTLETLAQAMTEEAELILLAEKSQMSFFLGDLSKIQDIWIWPMTEEEIRFRFLKWQETCKMRKDFWQTSHYLEATINHVPNLIWYKDKNGIHEKVNNSFCKTVNKTKQQVEGRGHAYIWDVEQDDPACIESEREVMERQKTFISEEIIQTGTGERTLMTYKSPLYDLDGSVMGTVGVAIDVTQERIYEQEIIQKNRTLEKIFTTIDCGVIRHSMDGKRVLSINRAALKILGYETQEELMADGFNVVAESIVEEDKAKLRECIKSLEKADDSVSVEYRVQHKNGEIRHIMGNIKLLMEDGELIFQRFLLDCTTQKLQEKKNEQRQMELIQALSIDFNIVCCFDLDTGVGIPLRNDKQEGRDFAPDSSGKIIFED